RCLQDVPQWFRRAATLAECRQLCPISGRHKFGSLFQLQLQPTLRSLPYRPPDLAQRDHRWDALALRASRAHLETLATMGNSGSAKTASPSAVLGTAPSLAQASAP